MPFLLAVSTPAFADYGERAKAERAEQAEGILRFKEAKVLKQQHKNTREKAIRRLAGTVEKLLSHTLGDKSEGYDPDQVLSLRGTAIFETKKAMTEDEERAQPRLGSGELKVRETEDSTEIERGELFALRVFADGDAFKIRNQAADVGSNGHKVSRLTEVEAEKRGRELIDELDLVPAPERSQLRFQKTRYVHFTGQVADPGDRVVATEIYFGREIDGVPVIGPKGSLIKLEVSGEHLTSITVDWASYAPDSTPVVQKPVKKDKVDARLRHHLKKLTEQDQDGLVVSSRICGYVDPGNRYQNDNIVQLGCLLNYGNEGELLELVPLAEKPIRDENWLATDDIEDNSQPAPAATRVMSTPDGELPNDFDSPGPDRGWSCSLSDGRAGGALAAGLGWLLVAGVAARRRRHGVTGGILFGVWALVTLSSGSARGEAGTLDYTSIMFKTYTAGSCTNHGAEQWANYNDFNDEMADESVCQLAMADTNYFYHYVFGSLKTHGWNGDLVNIQTHGREEWTNGIHHGYVSDRACVDWDVNTMEPPDGEMEVTLLHVCNIFTRNNVDNWYTFRNLHRYGAPVSAGCWGKCYLVNTLANTTYNEIGDELADGHSSVYKAWSEGHTVWTYDDDIFVMGLGVVGQNDCDDAARKAGFHNRMSYEGPNYQRNRPLPASNGDPELCGYYWDNL